MCNIINHYIYYKINTEVNIRLMKIVIAGVGYVGLVTGLGLAKLDNKIQFLDIDSNKIILEPIGKSTAPAIALAALAAGNDSLLLVLPADHWIEDEEYFNKLILEAVPLAESGKLVTFGVVPTDAYTGYGYIKGGRKLDYGQVVDQFVEKPSTQKAKQYFDSGEYYWNSGNFLFNSSRYLEQLNKLPLPII